MVKGLYTAYTGMINEQNRMDIMTNNLANASTVGYKKEGSTSQSFDDVLTVKIKDQSVGMRNVQRLGVKNPGVKIGENYTDYSQGSFRITGNTYDLALSGEGFFAIEFTNKAGETDTKYTRAGQFTLNKDGYLVTEEGDYVLDTQNRRIRLNTLIDSSITDDGTIYQNGQAVAKIQVTDFEDYDYLEKYFASASYRRDASSRFHPDKRWGNFWSASVAWVISKEAFLENTEWIDMLKLKASFGQQGNDALLRNGYANYYPYLDQYSMTGANCIFSDGTLYYKGNPDITWEKSNSFNIGTDFTLLNHKLEGTIEYFNRKTSDMLYNKPVANSNGYSSIPMNIGSMTNSGVEIELNYTPIDINNLKWNIFGNATFLKNKVNKLHPDLNGELISGSRIYREGESMYQLYLVKYAGVDPTTGQSLFWAKDDEGNAYTTADYAVASNCKEATGDLLPTVYGGFGTSLDFYGFDFSIQFSYQLGGKLWDYTYQDLMHGGSNSNAGYNWHKDIAKAWTAENPNTDVPRLCATENYDAGSSSDRWIVSSNYLSINNITLGYTLPKRIVRNLGIESLRVYGAADNVALFAARKGLDPRQGYVSSTTSTYGALRSISAGVKLTF